VPLEKLGLLHLIVVDVIEGKGVELIAQFFDFALSAAPVLVVVHEGGQHCAHVLVDFDVVLGKRELLSEQFVQLSQRVVFHHDYFVEVLHLFLQGLQFAKGVAGPLHLANLASRSCTLH
jgi:hypothetical protein